MTLDTRSRDGIEPVASSLSASVTLRPVRARRPPRIGRETRALTGSTTGTRLVRASDRQSRATSIVMDE